MRDPITVTGRSKLFSRVPFRKIDFSKKKFDPAEIGFAHLEIVETGEQRMREIRMSDARGNPISVITCAEPGQDFPISLVRVDYRIRGDEKQKRLTKAIVKYKADVSVGDSQFRLPFEENEIQIRNERFSVQRDIPAEDRR